jgi:hypothetical protein
MESRESRIFPLQGDETPEECPFCGCKDLILLGHPGSFEFLIRTYTSQQCNSCREVFHSMNQTYVGDPFAIEEDKKMYKRIRKEWGIG